MNAPDFEPAEDPGPTRRPGSPLRLVLAVAMILAGLVWIGQGLGILTAGRSFMIGDPTWAVIGAVFVVVGLAMAVRKRAVS
ncbi:MAG: hypothetical protein EPO36_11965 [Chloroflexota bacterium]|nr:MAG: hypothetical protein EPO36_11965 [Chloroflexota bacterium]